MPNDALSYQKQTRVCPCALPVHSRLNIIQWGPHLLHVSNQSPLPPPSPFHCWIHQERTLRTGLIDRRYCAFPPSISESMTANLGFCHERTRGFLQKDLASFIMWHAHGLDIKTCIKTKKTKQKKKKIKKIIIEVFSFSLLFSFFSANCVECWILSLSSLSCCVCCIPLK